MNPTTITANQSTPETFVRVDAGPHRIDFVFKEDTTATVTPKQTADPSNPDALVPITIDGEALVITASDGFIVYGPCFVGAIVASLSSGGAITILSSKSCP